MFTTIRTSRIVSKRKIMKRRFTRAATSGEVGPVASEPASSIRPELGPDEPDADDHGDRPTDEGEDDPELTEVDIALVHHRETEGKHDEERGGVDLDADPRAHLSECCERLAVLAALEHDAEGRQRDVSADPDHGGCHVHGQVDLVGVRRLREQDDRADEQERSRPRVCPCRSRRTASELPWLPPQSAPRGD